MDRVIDLISGTIDRIAEWQSVLGTSNDPEVGWSTVALAVIVAVVLGRLLWRNRSA